MTTRLLASLFLCLLAACVSARAQEATNLLRDPEASEGAGHWRAQGRVAFEVGAGGRVFVLRDGGSFSQDVLLPEGAQGRYALFVADAVCEGCSAEHITGRPYLYGMMLNAAVFGGARAYAHLPAGGRVYAYLQGDTMRAAASGWSRVWGVFRVPAGAGRIRFSLHQGRQNGVPYDGQVARFQRPALYLFQTEEQARLFAHGQPAEDTAADSSDAPRDSCGGASRLRGVGLGRIRLGMTPEEVKALFNDGDARTTFGGRPEADEFGHSHLTVSPSARADVGPLVKGYLVRFLDGRAYHVYADYADGAWDNTDALISATSESSSLPGPRAWRGAGPKTAKYLLCGGDEMRLYAAPSRKGGRAYGLLVDRAAERLLAERQATRDAKASR